MLRIFWAAVALTLLSAGILDAGPLGAGPARHADLISRMISDGGPFP